jgi:hypothetical protein
MSWEPFRIRDAKAAARQWINEAATGQPGFRGAFLHGSVNWMADDAPLPNYSDIDVIVVWDGPGFPRSAGKFIGAGVLLDVSYLATGELESAEAILGNSHLAGSFRGASVISDPSGDLTRLHAIVSQDFAQRHWVIRRCEHARNKVLRFLDGLDPSAPLHEQVTAWLFGTSVATHVLLSAGLRNPTVRKRYLATRELLAENGRLDVYEELLALLGCADWSRAETERHLAVMTEAFDAASEVIQSPFPFAADISDAGRPVAIDGSRELIETGYHREAAFWITATYSRCQTVLHADAPASMRDQFTPEYQALLADLGITSHADLEARAAQVLAYLPRLRQVAEDIADMNPEITA